MGQTISDIYRKKYQNLESMGYSHEEIMEMFPKGHRSFIEDSIRLSPFESHFGMTGRTFLISIVLVVAVAVLIVYACSGRC
jgi:hypothetical protein